MHRPGRPGGSARPMKPYVAAVGVYVCGSTLQCPVHRHRRTSQSRGPGVYWNLACCCSYTNLRFFFSACPCVLPSVFPTIFAALLCMYRTSVLCESPRRTRNTQNTKPNQQTGIDGVVSGRLAKSCRGGGLAEGMMYAPAMTGVDIVVVAGTVLFTRRCLRDLHKDNYAREG